MGQKVFLGLNSTYKKTFTILLKIGDYANAWKSLVKWLHASCLRYWEYYDSPIYFLVSASTNLLESNRLKDTLCCNVF